MSEKPIELIISVMNDGLEFEHVLVSSEKDAEIKIYGDLNGLFNADNQGTFSWVFILNTTIRAAQPHKHRLGFETITRICPPIRWFPVLKIVSFTEGAKIHVASRTRRINRRLDILEMRAGW